MMLRRTFCAMALLAGTALAADPTLLRLVPAEARMVAGIDFDRAKNSPFGQKILGEMKEEDAGFQKFVSSTGFDPRRDLREVILAATGPARSEAALIAVRGTFDSAKIGQFLRAQGAVSTLYKGVELWRNTKNEQSNGMVAFPNSSLAFFGKDDAVKAAIDRYQGAPTGMSAEVAGRVNDWSAKNDAWFVSTAALAELGVGKSGQNAILPGGLTVDAIREASAGVRFGSIVELTGEVNTRSAQDATALADVMRFLASMVRMNADKPGMEDALKVVDTLQVSTSGSAMKFSLSVSEDQLQKMLNKRGERSAPRAAVR